MRWLNQFSISDFLKSRQIAKALSLNPVVLKGLEFDPLWPTVKSLNGQCCVLSIWLEDVHDKARETLTADEYLKALGLLKSRILHHLSYFPTVVSISQGLYIQALFPQQISEQGFVSSATEAATELMKLIETFKVTEHGLSADSEAYCIVPVKMGLALGQIHAQFVKSGNAYECLASGQAVTLSRLLSADRNRYGMPILLDEATGNLVEQARPLDLYRTPGFTIDHVLYGLQTAQPKSLDQAFKELFVTALESLYDTSSAGSNSIDKAKEGFEKCLALAAEDKPGKQMLDSIQTLLSDKQRINLPKIRGFFAV